MLELTVSILLLLPVLFLLSVRFYLVHRRNSLPYETTLSTAGTEKLLQSLLRVTEEMRQPIAAILADQKPIRRKSSSAESADLLAVETVNSTDSSGALGELEHLNTEELQTKRFDKIPEKLSTVWSDYRRNGNGRFTIKELQKWLERHDLEGEVISGRKLGGGNSILGVDLGEKNSRVYIFPNFNMSLGAVADWYDGPKNGSPASKISQIEKFAIGRRAASGIDILTKGSARTESEDSE